MRSSRTATFIMPLQGKEFCLTFPFALGSCKRSSSSTGSSSSRAGSYSYGTSPPLAVGKAESLCDKLLYFESSSMETKEDLEVETVDSRRFAGSFGGMRGWLESREGTESLSLSSSAARR
jgi:hypothetical protein